jgi:MerR family transcriptional regulator, copper efflux regulator
MLGLNVHMRSSAPEPTATIGDVAVRFGLPQHVLRHWESVGLLTPVRDSSGHRRYGPAELARIAMILMGKEAGFGLGELQVVLSGPDPMRHADRLRRHVAVLDRRIAEATAAKELIEHALACPLPFDECLHAREQIDARIPAGPG